MSNVLIGIIGVILFIGLALAGALFLGPRFQDATMNSKASAIVASIQQVQNAVELYRTDTGSTGPVKMGVPTWLVASRHLKSQVANPIQDGTTTYWNTVNINNDPYPDATDEGGLALGKYVVAVLGTDAQAQKICTAIAKNTGTSMIINAPAPAIPVGCELYIDTYVAFGAI